MTSLYLLALVALRGALDHLAYYRLLGGEEWPVTWPARPLRLGPVSVRPYHVLLFAVDLATLYWLVGPEPFAAFYWSLNPLDYAVMLGALWQTSPSLARVYFVALLFAIPDALFYHLWKFRVWKQVMPNMDKPTTRLPVRFKYHKKAKVWPLQIGAFRLFVGRWPSEGEYRMGALAALLILLLNPLLSL